MTALFIGIICVLVLLACILGLNVKKQTVQRRVKQEARLTALKPVSKKLYDTLLSQAAMAGRGEDISQSVLTAQKELTEQAGNLLTDKAALLLPLAQQTAQDLQTALQTGSVSAPYIAAELYANHVLMALLCQREVTGEAMRPKEFYEIAFPTEEAKRNAGQLYSDRAYHNDMPADAVRLEFIYRFDKLVKGCCNKNPKTLRSDINQR